MDPIPGVLPRPASQVLANMELVRLALPRRVFTLSQVSPPVRPPACRRLGTSPHAQSF